MKTLKFMITAVLLGILGQNSFSQIQDHSMMTTSKTDTFKVWGSCEMCKVRIEKAAKINGVSKANWNDETKILTLVYDPLKVKTDDVLKKIAAVGHDTEKFRADDRVYNSLPSCCKYEREK